MHLNGVQVPIGDPEDTVDAKCFYLAAENYMKEIGERPKSTFLNDFEAFAASTVSRETYAENYEPYFCSLCEICLGKSRAERQVLLDYLSKVGELVKNYPELNSLVWNLLNNPASDANINTVSNLLSGWLDEAKGTTDPPFSDEEYAAVQESVRPLVTFLLTLAAADRYYKETGENGKTTPYPFYHLITFFTNLEDLIMPHLNIYIFEQLKQMDSYYTAGVRIMPGDVYIGEMHYTFNDTGWPLEDTLEYAGFSEEDLQIWRNGYDIRLENVLTLIPDPDMDLYIAAAGKFDKSMSMFEFYELTMTKTVGFRSYPVDPQETPVKLKENPICLTVPQEIAKKCVRYGVVRVDDLGVNHQYRLDTRVEFNENGDALLWADAIRPAVYASAIDDRRWCTSADVDRDDEVTVMDVTHTQRYLANMERFDDVQIIAADVDGDKTTTAVDVTWVQRWLAQANDVPYAIGKTISLQEP